MLQLLYQLDFFGLSTITQGLFGSSARAEQRRQLRQQQEFELEKMRRQWAYEEEMKKVSTKFELEKERELRDLGETQALSRINEEKK